MLSPPLTLYGVRSSSATKQGKIQHLMAVLVLTTGSTCAVTQVRKTPIHGDTSSGNVAPNNTFEMHPDLVDLMPKPSSSVASGLIRSEQIAPNSIVEISHDSTATRLDVVRTTASDRSKPVVVTADGDVENKNNIIDGTLKLSASDVSLVQRKRFMKSVVGDDLDEKKDNIADAALEISAFDVSPVQKQNSSGKGDILQSTVSLSSAVKQYVAGIVRGVKQANIRPLNANTGRSRQGVLCYALARFPAEDTIPLLAQQFARGCDAHFFFSHRHQEIGNVTILQAYSDADLERGWSGQMHYMVIAGVFSKLAEMGLLQTYSWYIKVDTDTFVRSTLRLGLERYASDHRLILAPIGLTVTTSDGYFIALAGALMNSFLEVGRRSSMCDEVTSGHNNLLNDTLEIPQDSHLDCVEQLGIRKEPFLDAQNQSLMFLDTRWQDCNMKSPDISSRLIEHFSKTNEAMCECLSHPEGYRGPVWCYSPQFAIVHPVKDPLKYRQLIDAFP